MILVIGSRCAETESPGINAQLGIGGDWRLGSLYIPLMGKEDDSCRLDKKYKGLDEFRAS